MLDWNNHSVRRINPDGRVETVMGGILPGDGPTIGNELEEPGADGIDVRLNHPTDIQFDADGRMILCAWHNCPWVPSKR